MTSAIISDIHGNQEALLQVLDDIEAHSVKEIICLGDCIGYGPDSEPVIQAVRKRGIPTLLGNHELAARDQTHLTWFNPRAKKSLEMTIAMLSPASLEFIQGLPTSLIIGEDRFVHGFPPDSVHTYLFQKTDLELMAAFNQMAQRICFVGHTHDLEIVEFDNRQITRRPLAPGSIPLTGDRQYIINVGSVGQPRDGSNEAKYVLWQKDENRIEVRCVPYDIDAVIEKINARGLPEENARRLL
jgi:diadenosine tetraphosphatase ApaH/serine/threonine PP2A family protein phosphatase